MELWQYLSPNSISGGVLFVAGSLVTFYLNLKAYKLKKI